VKPQARFAHKMLEQLVGLGDGVQLVIKHAGERKQIVALVLQSLHRTGLPMLHKPIAIDMTTPAGRMIIGSFGEFERAIIRGAHEAGLESARKQGHIGGRVARPWPYLTQLAKPERYVARLRPSEDGRLEIGHTGAVVQRMWRRRSQQETQQSMTACERQNQKG
jgi:DNA invertase Pin-like site-specific DNA recombinase